MNGDALRIRLRLQRAGFTLAVDLSLPAQGTTVLFGESGSGKTTLLRCVAGLERAPAGLVAVGNDEWQHPERNTFVPTWRRPLGYVFQEASLFDHLDVDGNLRFGLRRLGGHVDPAGLQAAVALLGIGALLKRKTSELSGGERQRVAIARALVTRPRLLLLDEPMASLDHARRMEVLPWIRRLRRELQIPMLYVTHSMDEVAMLADTLVVLQHGQVKASGPVAQVLACVTPELDWGDQAGALLEAEVAERDTAWQLARLTFPGGSLWLRDGGLAIGERVRVRVLGRDVSIATDPPGGSSIQNILPCSVQAIVADTADPQALVQLRCGESLLLARITRRAVHSLALAPGQAVWAQVKSVALVG